MRCRQAHTWLLAVHTAADLPPRVRQHVASCPRCARHQRRLAQLDVGLAAVQPPPPDPAKRQALLLKVAQTPQQRPTAARPRLARRWWLPPAAAAAAALLVLALGWRLVPPRPQRPPEQQTARGTANAARDQLVARNLNRALTLAEPLPPEQQVPILADMAADLRTEALRQARQGPTEELPAVAGLYGKVLRQGVAGRAHALPPGKREPVAGPLARRLRQASVETTRAADGPMPAVAKVLRRMADDEECTAQALLSGAALPEPPGAAPVRADRSLLDGVVLRALRLAEETDPLLRADCCAEMADEFAQAAALAAAGRETERAGLLAGSIDGVLERGVNDNLARADDAGLDDDRRRQRERISRKAELVVGALEANMEHAPDEVRPGLRKAVEAVRKVPEKEHERERQREREREREKSKPRTKPETKKD